MAGLLAGLLAGVLYGAASVLQAHAVRRLPVRVSRLPAFVGAAVRDARLWLVLVSYAAGFVAHVVAIRLVPLYLAQVTIAMSLPVAAVLALALGGREARVRWRLVGAVTLGMVLLAVSAGRAGASASHGALAITLWCLALALAAVGVVMSRRPEGRTGGLAVGALSGVGYAAVALAVRGVSDLGPASLATVAVMPALGGLAFWLYSVALDRGAVAVATGGQVVVQTAVPALAGLLVFDDQVRSGWWPVLVVGLVMAVWAATRLEQQQADSDEVSRASE